MNPSFSEAAKQYGQEQVNKFTSKLLDVGKTELQVLEQRIDEAKHWLFDPVRETNLYSELDLFQVQQEVRKEWFGDGVKSEAAANIFGVFAAALKVLGNFPDRAWEGARTPMGKFAIATFAAGLGVIAVDKAFDTHASAMDLKAESRMGGNSGVERINASNSSIFYGDGMGLVRINDVNVLVGGGMTLRDGDQFLSHGFVTQLTDAQSVSAQSIENGNRYSFNLAGESDWKAMRLVNLPVGQRVNKMAANSLAKIAGYNSAGTVIMDVVNSSEGVLIKTWGFDVNGNEVVVNVRHLQQLNVNNAAGISDQAVLYAQVSEGNNQLVALPAYPAELLKSLGEEQKLNPWQDENGVWWAGSSEGDKKLELKNGMWVEAIVKFDAQTLASMSPEQVKDSVSDIEGYEKQYPGGFYVYYVSPTGELRAAHNLETGEKVEIPKNLQTLTELPTKIENADSYPEVDVKDLPAFVAWLHYKYDVQAKDLKPYPFVENKIGPNDIDISGNVAFFQKIDSTDLYIDFLGIAKISDNGKSIFWSDPRMIRDGQGNLRVQLASDSWDDELNKPEDGSGKYNFYADRSDTISLYQIGKFDTRDLGRTCARYNSLPMFADRFDGCKIYLENYYTKVERSVKGFMNSGIYPQQLEAMPIFMSPDTEIVWK